MLIRIRLFSGRKGNQKRRLNHLKTSYVIRCSVKQIRMMTDGAEPDRNRPRLRPWEVRHGMEAEGRNRSLRVRFTTARPRSARDAQHSNLLVGAPVPVAEDRPDVL